MRVRQIVDLSVPLGPQTVVYPGDPSPEFEVHSSIARDGFNLLHLSMGSQTGTHVDAPYHFQSNGLRIDEMDLSLFVGPAALIDVSGHSARQRIRWDVIAPQARAIAGRTIVLLRTGWSVHYGTPGYFDHPLLDAGACERLLDMGVRTFLIDAVNIDETPDADHPGEGYPVHHLIASAGGVIGENLRNFDRIDFDPFVSCLPVKLVGADGAPVRAVAMDMEP